MSDSPLESDRTELLRVADPVDYSGHTTADLYFSDIAPMREDTGTKRSGQSTSASRPQTLPVDQRWCSRPSGRPPRNIFDDI